MARRDRPSIWCEVKANGLLPLDQRELAQLHARHKVGTRVRVDTFEARNMALSAKYWDLLGKVVPNTDVYISAEDLNTALKIRLSLVDSVALIGGGMRLTPRSLTDLSSEEFKNFFEASMVVIAEEVIPGLDLSLFVDRHEIAMLADAA